ncbi:MAG TPA: alpha/beta fold hydrolase [Polyangia bacterium]|nr:alpha/beta fold hydrolase [Polyangia bacterium]
MRRTIGALELGYETHGDGPALLLLHAFPLDRRMWSETARALAGRERVIALDFRGFGESALGAEPVTLEALADDAARLLDALGVPMATVLGLSLGGYVALAFAARHPARLGRLVLADTRAGADSPDGKGARDEGIAKVRAHGAAAFVEPMPARLLSPRASETLRAEVRALGASQAPEAIAAALAAMRDRPDRSAELARIDCPTLVLVGADDALTPPAEARALAAAIRGARLVEIGAAGHLSNLEAPAAFHDALTQFLDEKT